MSNRELMELAAKAEGRPAPWDQNDVFSAWVGSMENGHWWNPLHDDGDALRLAIKLDIHIKRFAGATTCQEWTGVDSITEHDHWANNDGDPMRSTRLAIVRAAAKIGEAMP